MARVLLYRLPHSKGSEIHLGMKSFSSCPFLHCVSLIFSLLTGFNNLWFFHICRIQWILQAGNTIHENAMPENFRLRDPPGKPRSVLRLSPPMVVWCICCHCPRGCRVTVRS